MKNKERGSFVAEAVQYMPQSGIRKFFDLIEKTEGIISLGVGEPDYITPQPIREACMKAMTDGRTKYTSNSGAPELREEISHYLYKSYGIRYNQEDILVTVGVSEALDLAMRAIINPGDEVLIGEPCYVSYAPNVSLAGGVPVLVPARAEDGFKLKKKDLIARINERTKALLLSYPNNPTGAIMERADLEEIAQVAKLYNIMVISDEVYAELTYGKKHVSFASLPDMTERTILLNGFSKAYAMTGWRLGFAAGPDEIIKAMLKIHQYTMLCAPTMSQFAGVSALRNCAAYVDEMVAEYDKRRRFIVKGLSELGLPCFEPGGAFYVFPSITGTGMTSEEFCEKLLFEERLAVVPGNAFGPSGEGHIRCCYAISQKKMEEALERLERFLRRYRQTTNTAIL